jgi:hypothetical protein
MDRRGLQMGLVKLTSLILLLVQVGCGAADGGLNQGCVSSAECKPQSTCVFSYCIAKGENQLVLQARLIPPGAGKHVEQQIPFLAMSDGPALEITMLDSVRLVGLVTLKDAPLLSYNVPGHLEARTEGDLAGHDYRFSTRSLDGLSEEGHGYELFILPGRDYTMTFRADDPAIPPHTFTLPADKAVNGILNIELPADKYVRVAGFVRFDPMTPVEGAMVSAILPSGLVTTGASSSWDKGPPGYFEFDLPPNTETVQIRVHATEKTPLFSEYVTDVRAVDLDMAVWVPDPGVAIEGKVKLMQDTPSGEKPVTETVVTLEYQGGKLRLNATTDAEGVARFDLLKGDYKIAVAPQPASSLAAYEGKASFEVDRETVPVTLSTRVKLTGVVQQHAGDHVDGGTIRLSPHLSESTLEDRVLSPIDVAVAVDPSGFFEAWLDPGPYTMRYEPEGSEAPAAIYDGIVEPPAQINLVLPEVGLAYLVVRDTAGQAVAGVAVELYLPPQDASEQPRLLVKGTTDGHGRVGLLIPHEVAP